MSDQPVERRLSEQQMRRVLERAIQLDAARMSDTSIEELTRVAQELNISSVAIEQALRELDRPLPAAPIAQPEPKAGPKRKSRFRSWLRTSAIAFGALLLGSINANTGNDPAPSIIISTLAVIAMVLKHRRDASPDEFQRDAIALYAGLGLGWMMQGRPLDEGYVYSITLLWLSSSTIGGFLTRFKSPWQKKPNAPSVASPAQ